MSPQQMDDLLFFREKLLAWAAQNPRPMPWKGERDPYKIWLSEVILQQTRVEQGLPYYLKFLAAYPDVQALAAAPEASVLKNWEGLGYYSRARNLHATAKHVAQQLQGRFPDSYAGLRALKGVGDYTAAAIAAFAYGLPHAVLDGNVYRILARFFGEDTPVDAPSAKKTFAALAQALLDPERPGAFNQAMMDFGATHCTPKQPQCATCPVQARCAAWQQGRVAELPVKAKRLDKKARWFCYAVFQLGGDTIVRLREGRDIWRGLHDFPGQEMARPADLPSDKAAAAQWLRQHFFGGADAPRFEVTRVSGSYRQTLTHQQIGAVFVELALPEGLPEAAWEAPAFAGCQRLPEADLKKNIAVPRLIDWYLRDKAGTLGALF